jgi:hypothetical protein
MILVYAHEGDEHAHEAMLRLRARRLPCLRLDAERFPSRVRMELSATPGEPARVDVGEGPVDLGAVHTVLWRGPLAPDAALQELFASLDCRYVPGPPSRLVEARPRVRQLRLAAALGLRTPPALVTNDPVRAHAFRVEHGKMARAPRQPALLVARIQASSRIRVTVVGARVFAVEVDARGAHRPHPLPDRVARACVSMARCLGLLQTGIDLVCPTGGEHVFVALDPSGDYLHGERLTGLPMTDALVDLLAEPR